MCSLRFENNFLTIEHVRFRFENICLTIEGVRFASISKKTPLSFRFASVAITNPIITFVLAQQKKQPRMKSVLLTLQCVK
jgi:hypothetical protein